MSAGLAQGRHMVFYWQREGLHARVVTPYYSDEHTFERLNTISASLFYPYWAVRQSGESKCRIQIFHLFGFAALLGQSDNLEKRYVESKYSQPLDQSVLCASVIKGNCKSCTNM